MFVSMHRLTVLPVRDLSRTANVTEGKRVVSLDDSGCGRGWLLIGLCQFSAVVSGWRVLAALHPGAIVIMHDGGGNRAQTVAALPAIIHGIRMAGYQIVPVCGGPPRTPASPASQARDITLRSHAASREPRTGPAAGSASYPAQRG